MQVTHTPRRLRNRINCLKYGRMFNKARCTASCEECSKRKTPACPPSRRSTSKHHRRDNNWWSAPLGKRRQPMLQQRLGKALLQASNQASSAVERTAGVVVVEVSSLGQI